MSEAEGDFRFYSVAAIVQTGPDTLQLQVGSCRARSEEEAIGAMTREAERKCPNCAVVKVGAGAIDFEYLTTPQAQS